MSDWHQAKVEENTPAADQLFHLVLDVEGTGLGEAHQLPGQYVKLSLDGVGEGYFAIASAPGDGHHFELLIKAGSPLATALAQAKVGSLVRISAPLGKGFPLEAAKGKNVLLFATGSGIGAIRSAIETIRREREAFGEVTLFFGVRTPAAFAYQEELKEWERARIRVVRTVSQPGRSGWNGLTGYVQAHLGEVNVDGAVAFVVGQKAMVQGVTEALERRGLPKERVFLNF
ncbi:MAG: NAD-binding oxidoreductase [Myxococcota bacterium]